MKLNKLIPIVSIIGVFIVVAGVFSISVNSLNINVINSEDTAGNSKKQSVPMYVLESLPIKDSNNGFNKNLAISSSSEGENLYVSQRNTRVLKIKNLKNKNEKNLYIGEFNSLAVNDDNLFVAGDAHLRTYDKDGKRVSSFSIPTKNPRSIAALDNDDIAVETTDTNGLLTVFDKSGKRKHNVGKIKILDNKNEKQNLFLNQGNLASDQLGNIYHVPIFSTNPIVQKFSKQGKLLKEFPVEGSTINLQATPAEKLLAKIKPSCVAGYYIIQAATVDLKTGHLWIAMSGSYKNDTALPESAVLYEYNSEGEKLSEYALKIPTRIPQEVKFLIDPREIAVSYPNVYILDSTGKLFNFDLNDRLPLIPLLAKEKSEYSITSFIKIKIDSIFSSTQDTCPPAISYECDYPCQIPQFTSQTGQTADCDTELNQFASPTNRLVSSTCSRGSNVGTYGGCQGSITTCNTQNGINTEHSATILCQPTPTPTPTPTPAPTPDGGGGPNNCDGGAQNEGSCLADLNPDDCWNTEACGSSSPIVIDIAGNGFNLTNNAGGVAFDLNRDGMREQLSWTAANSDDAWLVLDRNSNGKIDNGGEMFGNFSWQFWSENPNGFNSLAWFDRTDKGGNGDGVINSDDPVFSGLRLWQDKNHNGISESNELFTLPQLDIVKIELDYKTSKRTDDNGNEFRYRAKVWDAKKNKTRRWAWDVFLRQNQ